MPIGINKTNFLTPQQNSRLNNENIKSESNSVYKNSKSAIKQINQKLSNVSSRTTDLIKSAKNHISGSNMDELYNIKDTNIHGKENKRAADLDKIKYEFLMKNLGEDNVDTVNHFNFIADNVMNKSGVKISNSQLEKFKENLKTIKDDITPRTYTAVKVALEKLL